MAHKVVLASCSPYLHSILMRLRHSHQQPVIFLSRINITDLTKLVAFMYTGQVEVEESQLESFLRSAAELQVKGLVASSGGSSFQPDASTVGKEVKHEQKISKNLMAPVCQLKPAKNPLKRAVKTKSSSENALPKENCAKRLSSKAKNVPRKQVSHLLDEREGCALSNSESQLDSKSGVGSRCSEGRGGLTGPGVAKENLNIADFEGDVKVRATEACLTAGAKSFVEAEAIDLKSVQNICLCGQVKVVRTVMKKESENEGRKFFTCPKKLQPCTGSFQWCDQTASNILQRGESSGLVHEQRLKQDNPPEGSKEIKEIEIVDANGDRIAPAKLNNHLQPMYQRLQAGKFQCNNNNCGKVLSSRQKVMTHLETHLGLSLPCSVLENIHHIFNDASCH